MENKDYIEKATNRLLYYFKSLYLFIGYTYYFFILLQIQPGAEKAPKCTWDSSHSALSDVNDYLEKNRYLVNSFITLSSLIYDLVIPATIIFWIIWDRSLRFAIAFLLIHLVRYMCLYVHVIKAPNNIIWNDPQTFPSLTVSYEQPTLFFFNGHCAILALSVFYTLTLNNWRKKLGLYIFLPCLLFQMILALCLRVNYSIDIYFGVVTAHYFFWVSKRIGEYFVSKLNPIDLPKATILGIIIFCIHIYFVKIYKENEQPNCILDRGFELTESINRYLQGRTELSRIYLISLAAILDLNSFIFPFLSIFYIKGFGLISYAIPCCMIRSFSIYMLMLPLPPDPIWFPTGIVSAYPFIITADFFYSGHILGLSGCAMMAYSNGGKLRKMAIFLSWPVVVYESIALVVTRNHYTIDIIYGIIMIHYTMHIINLFLPKIDGYFEQLSLKIVINRLEKKEN